MIKFVTDDVDVTAAGRPIIVTGQSTDSAPMHLSVQFAVLSATRSSTSCLLNSQSDIS
jgi:hypothetical protein